MAGKNSSYSNSVIVDESDMQYVELHRAQSLVNSEIVIPEKNKEENPQLKSRSVVLSVGTAARKFCIDVNYLKVEVVMFLYMFSYVLRSITNTVLMMDKVCLVHLGRSESECSALKDDISLKYLKEEVEKMTNNYHVGHTLLAMAPSAILSLFIGAWSDKYSRKVPIIVAMIGIIIDGFGVTLCSYFYLSRVEYMYITPVFTGLSGGFIGVLLVLYSYASDISRSEERMMRYALMEMAFGLSMPLGSLAGGWMYKFFGFLPVFLTSTCGHILGLFWVLFMLDETRGLDNKDSWQQKFRNFWSTDSLVNAFKATTKKRPNRGREQIWGLILGMSVSVFAFASSMSIGYLYVFHRYKWDNTQYSTVSAIFSIMGIIIMLIAVPVSKKNNIRDVILGLVGTISLMAKMLCMGLAESQHFYFLACFLGLLASLGTLAGRAKISKITPNEDLGKVFAFLTTAESILPLMATAIISQGYNASLKFFPGLVYVVMGILCIIPASIFLWISRIPNANYDSVTAEQEKSEPSNSQEQ